MLNLNYIFKQGLYHETLKELLTDFFENYSGSNIINYSKPFDFIVNGEVITDKKNHFLYKYILMMVYTLEENHDLIDYPTGKPTSIGDHLNDHIWECKPENVNKLKIIVHRISYYISELAIETNLSYGQTLNLRYIVDEYVKNEDLRRLVNFKYDVNDSFDKILNIKQSNKNMLKDVFSDTKNPYTRMIKSGCISLDQFIEIIAPVGLKLDLKGNIYPTVINSSYLRGLVSKSEFFAVSLSSRKALINNFMYVGSSGYFSRKNMLSGLGNFIVEDKCDSVNYVEVDVVDKYSLEILKGRYIFDTDTQVTPKRLDLIGSKVKLYSPITCTASHTREKVILKKHKNITTISKDIDDLFTNAITEKSFIVKSDDMSTVPSDYSAKVVVTVGGHDLTIVYNNEINIRMTESRITQLRNEFKLWVKSNVDSEKTYFRVYTRKLVKERGICKRCYGEIYKFNQNISSGLVSVTILTSFFIQRLLSSKHLLKVILDTNDTLTKFLRLFKFEDDNILTNVDCVCKLIYSEDGIDVLGIEVEGDQQFLFDELNVEPNMSIRDISRHYLSEFTSFKESDVVIGGKLGSVELSKPLMDVSRIIDSKNHNGINNDYNDILNVLNESIAKSGKYYPSVFSEILLKNLVRLKENDTYPDFSKPVDMDDINVMSLSESNLMSMSVIVRLSFERLKKVITTPSTYKVSEDSLLDDLFI